MIYPPITPPRRLLTIPPDIKCRRAEPTDFKEVSCKNMYRREKEKGFKDKRHFK